MRAISSSGWNGLTMSSSAPARRPLTRCSTSASAVSMMIGTRVALLGGADLLGGGVAVELRHRHVHQDQVRLRLEGHLHAGGPVGGDHHLVALLLEGEDEDALDVQVVIDDQDLGGHAAPCEGGKSWARLYGRHPVEMAGKEVEDATLVRLGRGGVRIGVGGPLDDEQLLRLPRRVEHAPRLLGAHRPVVGRGDQQEARAGRSAPRAGSAIAGGRGRAGWPRRPPAGSRAWPAGSPPPASGSRSGCGGPRRRRRPPPPPPAGRARP